MKRLIITGDDFGLAVPVNEAIEIAHRDGILSTASLMVGAEATADAVERAREIPTLRVGLHIVLVEGRPVLAAEHLPDLVDENGEFHRDLVACGIRFFFRPAVRRQLEAEIMAQFEAFWATGLPLDHVNAHKHLHLHPTVLGLIMRMGRRFGLRAVRVPYEPPLAAWRASGANLAGMLASSFGYGLLTALLRLRLHRAGLYSNDYVLGLSDSGRMGEELMLRQIEQLRDGVTEMYFHPATRSCPAFDRFMASYRPTDELAALTSPRVRRALRDLGVRPTGFADLVP